MSNIKSKCQYYLLIVFISYSSMQYIYSTDTTPAVTSVQTMPIQPQDQVSPILPVTVIPASPINQPNLSIATTEVVAPTINNTVMTMPPQEQTSIASTAAPATATSINQPIVPSVTDSTMTSIQSTSATSNTELTSTTASQKNSTQTLTIQSKLKTLNTLLSQMQQIKKSLDEQLMLLDKLVSQMQEKIVVARKKYMEILQHASEEKATSIKNELTVILKDIKDMQQQYTNSEEQFKTSSETIKSVMQDTKNIITYLQSEGINLKLADLRYYQRTNVTTEESAPLFKKWLIPEKQHESVAPQKTYPTFIHYIFDITATLITTTMSYIKSFFYALKNMFFPIPNSPALNQSQQKNQPILPITASDQIQTTSMDKVQNSVTNTTNNFPATIDSQPATAIAMAGIIQEKIQLQENIDEYKHDLLLDHLLILLQKRETETIDFVKNYQTLRLMMQKIDSIYLQINLTLANNSDIASQLSNLDQLVINKHIPPVWRKKIEHFVGTCIDTCIITKRYICRVFSSLYTNHLAPRFVKFKQDVEQEIAQQKSTSTLPVIKNQIEDLSNDTKNIPLMPVTKNQ